VLPPQSNLIVNKSLVTSISAILIPWIPSAASLLLSNTSVKLGTFNGWLKPTPSSPFLETLVTANYTGTTTIGTIGKKSEVYIYGTSSVV
jgi:hypothetical protein